MNSSTKRKPNALAFDEAQFQRLLDLECRRCERTGMRFTLVLVHLDSLGRIPDPAQATALAETLASDMRETDITGWYRPSSDIGIILTTLNGFSRETTETRVVARVRESLAATLEHTDAARVRISCHEFPVDAQISGESGGRGDGESDRNFFVKDAPGGQSDSMTLKRAIDIAGSLGALMLLSPLFLLIATLIKVTSPGPVFFRQTRVGQFGRPFRFLKFRSMYKDNDPRIHREYVSRFIDSTLDESQGVFKITDDPRVTSVGRLIRKTSLDELPQFFNVLRGDMSLVGPRPPIPYELEKYSLWHLRRIQEARPGITGIWQVEGRSRTSFDEMVRMDLRYIRNRSVWLDIKILLKTPAAVLTGAGAH